MALSREIPGQKELHCFHQIRGLRAIWLIVLSLPINKDRGNPRGAGADDVVIITIADVHGLLGRYTCLFQSILPHHRIELPSRGIRYLWADEKLKVAEDPMLSQAELNGIK